jgi:serine/threonine protein kinase
MEAGYAEWLDRRGFAPQRRGIWVSVGVAEGTYGWKLHLSSVQRQALPLMEAVTGVLARHAVPFKVARDSGVLGMLNEGSFGATQVGKFMTVYPACAESSLSLARELIDATHGFDGPRIVTDLHLGRVVYARYGSFNPRVVRDRLGNIGTVSASPKGEYSVPFVVPDGVPNPFGDFSATSRETPAAGPIGPGYLILRALSVHAKGSVYLAVDLRRNDRADLVVLKEGRRHCLSDGLGRDMWDRLRHQSELHRTLCGKVRVPKAQPLFEHAGNLYLPLGYVHGRDLVQHTPAMFSSFDSAGRIRVLRDLCAMAETLGDLHRERVVHRDLSPRNIRVTPDGQVHLLDLELSHRLDAGDVPPFAQGTPGFTSPQQVAGAIPACADDIFSFGAVIVSILTAIDPQRVLFLNEADRAVRIRALSGAPSRLCSLAADCLSAQPELRPGLEEIRQALEAGQGIRGRIRADAGGRKLTAAAEHALVSAALRWILDEAPRDPVHHLWISPEIESSKHDATLRLPHAFQLYRSASRGVAGVVYAVSRLHRVGFAVPGTAEQVGRAVDWLLDHEPTPDDQMPGLHFGEAGVAMAVGEAVRAGLIPQGPWLPEYLQEALSGPLDWPDLTHGAAGQGLAALCCAALMEMPSLAAHAAACADYLTNRQTTDGSWVMPEGVPGMEGAVYTGFGHGVAGMTYFLATFAKRSGDTAAAAAAHRGGEWLMAEARRSDDGTALWWPMQSGSEEVWSWWCHGGPGIALALLSLFELTGDERYASAARSALRIHPADLRYSNMSQCHGLSGVGEILLEAHRILDEPEWLHRAKRVGGTLRALARTAGTGASWLVENPYQPTADFMIGCGGVAHFLARLAVGPGGPLGMPLIS